MKIKLYKNVNGERRLVNFGVLSCAYIYVRQGYEVEWVGEGDTQKLWSVVKAEFDGLWSTLSHSEQVRLADIPMDDEMTIEQKLAFVKAEIASRPRRVAPVYKARKASMWERITGFVNNCVSSNLVYA